MVDMWSETCLVEVYPMGGSKIKFAASLSSVDIDMGDKDVEQIPTLSGGRLIKKVPQDIATITFEGYSTDIDAAGGTGFAQLFHDIDDNWDASEPLEQQATRNRQLYRVTILWTDDTSATEASGATADGTNSLRFIAANCYMTSYKQSFTDGELKATMTFKVPAFYKDGSANIKEQSATGTGLSALGSYTSETSRW